MRILVVEDERLIIELYKRHLKAHSLTFYNDIATASIAMSASKHQANEFDLVVTDLMQPNSSGFELLERQFLSVGRPVIIVSGFIRKELVLRAREKPNLHVLEKPIDWQHFLTLIESYDLMR